MSKRNLVKEWVKHDPLLEDTDGFVAFCTSELAPASERRLVEKQTDKLVFAMVGPIITWPQYRDVPKWLIDCVKLERLAGNLKELKTGEDAGATDAEALIYLNTTSLAIPLDHGWYRIYLYLFNLEFKRWKKPVPEGLEFKGELSPSEKSDLYELKHWLHRKAWEYFKQKKRRGGEG